jgi:prepilin-type N-terminal cleavage/methylation domain-containing protein
MTATRSPNRLRARGFTLLEAMVTIAVAAVLLLVAVPTYGDFAARHRLMAVSESMAHDMGLARLEAAQRGVPVYVVARPGPDWCYAITTRADCDCRPAQASCALRRVARQDHAGLQLVEARTVSFDPSSGRAEGGLAAAWKIGDRFATEVHVHPAGRARVCTAGGPLRGVPAC